MLLWRIGLKPTLFIANVFTEHTPRVVPNHRGPLLYHTLASMLQNHMEIFQETMHQHLMNNLKKHNWMAPGGIWKPFFCLFDYIAMMKSRFLFKPFNFFQYLPEFQFCQVWSSPKATSFGLDQKSWCCSTSDWLLSQILWSWDQSPPKGWVGLSAFTFKSKLIREVDIVQLLWFTSIQSYLRLDLVELNQTWFQLSLIKSYVSLISLFTQSSQLNIDLFYWYCLAYDDHYCKNVK